MKKVSVENIEAGMVLSKDVASTSGNVLLGKGTALNPAMGRRLKNWGIFFVYIEGEEESEAQEETATISPEEVKKQLEEKFSGVLDSLVMKKILDAVYEFRINKGAR